MIDNPRQFLLGLLDAAVEAAHPRQVLEPYLPDDRSGRAVVIGAGKAAAAMAAEFERLWQGPLSGLVVTRYGHGEACRHIDVIEAAHPVPDTAGREAAARIVALVSELREQDQVFCLLSGGGSSLLSLPAPGVSLEDKQAINRALLNSGAAIAEINCVRKHLSAIKGGRLARACWPARLHTLAISDVPGDDPSVIASGPTVADDTTSADARAVLKKYEIEISPGVEKWLSSQQSETLKTGDPMLQNSRYTLVAKPQQSLEAAAREAQRQGIAALILSDCIEGEAREVAKVHAAIAQQVLKYRQPLPAPCVIISGGETSVTVTGAGRGGRNAEFLLAMASVLKGQAGIYALAADTDGIDGSESNAGCLLTPQTYSRALEKRLDCAVMLENNDGYGFFSALDDLVVTGPTRTNVNDFRAILILPPAI